MRRPCQARAKRGVFKSSQDGNLAKTCRSRKAAALLFPSKTRPESSPGPRLPQASPQIPGPQAVRTGPCDPVERVVAERGCFKSAERARPPAAASAARRRDRRAPLLARPRCRRRRRAPPARSPALKSLPGSMLTCYFLYGGMASFQPRAPRSSPACARATTFRSMD